MTTEPHDIMIDLEALGRHEDGAIIQIAGVLFDPYSQQEPQRLFNEHILFEDALKYGTADGSTIKWWMSQEAARKKILSHQEFATTMNKALRTVQKAISAIPDACVWGHGATFDITLLGSAYRRCEIHQPWKYRNVRDTRTVFWLANTNLNVLEPATEELHDALYDAKRQAKAIQKAVAIIKNQQDFFLGANSPELQGDNE